jgi:hypothetical protein
MYIEKINRWNIIGYTKSSAKLATDKLIAKNSKGLIEKMSVAINIKLILSLITLGIFISLSKISPY